MQQVLAPLRGAIVWSVVFSLSINLLMLTVPLYLLQIFDRVLTSRSLDTLWVLTAIALMALITYGLLEALRRLLLSRVGALLDMSLGPTILQTLLRQSPNTGQQSARALRDLTTLRQYLSGNALIPLLDAPWSVIFLAVVFMLHSILGWLSLASFVLLFLVALLNEKLTRDALQQSAGHATIGNETADAALGNAEAVIAMGMTAGVTGRWEDHHRNALTAWEFGGQRLSVLTSSSKVLRLILQIMVLGVGATLAIAGELTAGGMIAASILVTRALAPVEQLISSWGSTLAARKAYSSVSEILAEVPPSAASSTELPAPTGRVLVEAMSYIHPEQQDPILKALSFGLQPGESLGLIGPTGSGKTTLARLLLGVLKPRLGNIRLDGMNISEWNEQDRGQYIGYLPQDTELFAGTVAENIARFSTAPTSEDIVAAAQLAGAHDMILQLARGYDTQIGPRGAALSGGQRQRIALARALFGPIKLVVLDEPNANQDRAGEIALLQALLRLKEQGITSVIIAHRPVIIEHVDKILVIKDGRMAAFGPKDEVLASLADNATTEAAS
jgi:ATP-binding cassette, subfamily C, type I secretion system permease/ATPase